MSLAYLRKKKLITYADLRRPGAIKLLSKNWENKINWTNINNNNIKAFQEQQKMRDIMITKKCRRRLLLD